MSWESHSLLQDTLWSARCWLLTPYPSQRSRDLVVTLPKMLERNQQKFVTVGGPKLSFLSPRPAWAVWDHKPGCFSFGFWVFLRGFYSFYSLFCLAPWAFSHPKNVYAECGKDCENCYKAYFISLYPKYVLKN